jgi:hypothetical protein
LSLDISVPIQGYLSISGNVPLTLLVILTVIFGWRFSLKKRLILTALGEMVSFGVIAVVAGVDTDLWQDRLVQLKVITL